MSVSQQSVLGSSQNLIASHVAGCNPPTLKNTIALPTTITTAAPYFANISGALYTIPIVAAAATIVLPFPTVSKGYQFDFVFTGTETKTVTFAPLLANGTVGTAVDGSSLSCIVGHGLTFAAAAIISAVSPGRALMVCGVAAVFPGIGDRVSFFCDGTNWHVQAIAAATAGATTAFSFTASAAP